MVVHAINAHSKEIEAGKSLILRLAWSRERIPGQPGLHEETLSQETNERKKCHRTKQRVLKGLNTDD